MNKHEPLFACFSCGEEQTFPYNHLRTHGGELWCSYCWHGLDKDTESGIEYSDLPAFVPEADQKIKALADGLLSIKKHMEMAGAGYVSSIWQIADIALRKAEAAEK